MQDQIAYRKVATLINGNQVVVRFLNGQDRDGLIKFFQQAPQEDVQFCKEDVKNPKTLDFWLNPKNAPRIMALVAEDLATKQIVASLNLFRGQQAALNIGEIQQILVARSFQGLGLGSIMLNELIDLTMKENFRWLKVEVVWELKNVIRAFQSKGFEIKVILEDYFRDLKGRTYDVALMIRHLVQEEEDF